jgi:hypothetical protein
MNIDLSLNRVYWEYIQNNSYLRPETGYWCSNTVPSMGVRVTVPEYKKRSKSFKHDLTLLVKAFAEKYKDYKFVLAMSGGIDSEVTAEAFYELGIPFRGLSQKLFDVMNIHDIVYAAKYCKERNIDHTIINMSMDLMLKQTIPDAIKHGQFTHSYSQIALTNLFNHIDREKEILIFSGHNPDFHRQIGIGWWEDSPNIVKYAIAKDYKFFTFTSLEPIFCHYASNFDGNQPGDKDNDFLYEAYPHLIRRVKMTGWEKGDNITPIFIEKIRSCAAYDYQTFITWERFTKAYMQKLILQKRLERKRNEQHHTKKT